MEFYNWKFVVICDLLMVNATLFLGRLVVRKSLYKDMYRVIHQVVDYHVFILWSNF